MTTVELSRPIEIEQLCDWAFSKYLLLKNIDPNWTELAIARKIFESEYKKDTIPLNLKELADTNVESIDSLPDLILSILNMEARDGRTDRLYTMFIHSMAYSIKVHLPKIGGNTQLQKIAEVFRIIQNEINKSSFDEKRRFDAFQSLSITLIGNGFYKNYKTSNEITEIVKIFLTDL